MLHILPILSAAAGVAVVSASSAAHAPVEARNNWPVANVQVDITRQFQEVDGWGSSQAFQRAEDLLGKYGLSPKNITYLLDLMYDVDKGAGFTILRYVYDPSDLSYKALGWSTLAIALHCMSGGGLPWYQRYCYSYGY